MPDSTAVKLLLLLLITSCADGGGSFDRGESSEPDDDDASPDDDDATDVPCLLGEAADCPAASCAELLQLRPELSSPGVWWLDATNTPFRARCELDPAGGQAWTLLLVSADDAIDTWTWSGRGIWTDSATVGSLDALDTDFKSEALAQLPVADLAFRHHPSGAWVEYAGIGDRMPLGEHLDIEVPCWQPGEGIAPTGGDVELLDGLCDPNLYLNAVDQDGDAGCGPPEPHRSDAFGPAWSAAGNDGCPFDDVGELSSLGSSALEDPAIEYGAAPDGVSRGIGFGQQLGLNSGAPGSGENRMEVWGR